MAVVGTHKITEEALGKFVLNLPLTLRTDKEGQEAREDYLQTLIDRELLLLEAHNRGLDEDSDLLKKLKNKQQEHIISIFRKRNILPQVAVSEEEIRRYFENQGMGRERLLTAILVETEDKAREILAQIEAGRGFETLAHEHSLDPTSVRNGGALGFVNRPMAERQGIPRAVFDSLRTGAVSPPIPWGKRYHLVRFLEDRAIDLRTHRETIRQQLLKEKRHDIEAQKIELLAYDLHWQIAPEGWELLRKRAESLGTVTALQLTGKERTTPLFTYKGGKITVDEFIDVLRAHGINADRALHDSTFIAAVGRRFILPSAMLMEAAVRAGIPEEPEVLQWNERIKREFLLKQLRQQEISDKISVNDYEVQQFYEDHPEMFRIPETICFDELMVPTMEEAQKLRAEITEGTDLVELARERGYPIRPRNSDSLVCMLSLARTADPRLWEALKAAPIGELAGPVATRDGYSIFKVLRQEGVRPEPFEQARKRARAALVKRMENQYFDEWLGELHQTYQDQVTVFVDHLESALPETLLTSK